MSKELTIRPDQAIIEVGNQIDEIVNECLPVAAQENQNFVQALTLANGIKALRQIILHDPHIKETVESMQNTHLGFMTDRTSLAIWKAKQNNKELKPYRYEDVAEVCIEAMLKGYRITNNEFNMIASRFYAAKNGKFRRIQECEGVTDFQFTTTSPAYEPVQGGVQYAKVQAFASWRKDGQLATLGSSAAAEDKLIFKIRVNKMMGEDAIVGKALSKLFSRVLMRLEGKIMPEATDVSDEDVIEGELATGSASDLADKIKENGADKEQGAGGASGTPPDRPPQNQQESPPLDPETPEEREARRKAESYFKREFDGLRSTFPGKLRNHISNGKIKEATAEDIRALEKKWVENKETSGTPFPYPTPPPEYVEEQSQSETDPQDNGVTHGQKETLRAIMETENLSTKEQADFYHWAMGSHTSAKQAQKVIDGFDDLLEKFRGKPPVDAGGDVASREEG